MIFIGFWDMKAAAFLSPIASDLPVTSFDISYICGLLHELDPFFFGGPNAGAAHAESVRAVYS